MSFSILARDNYVSTFTYFLDFTLFLGHLNSTANTGCIFLFLGSTFRCQAGRDRQVNLTYKVTQLITRHHLTLTWLKLIFAFPRLQLPPEENQITSGKVTAECSDRGAGLYLYSTLMSINDGPNKI